MKNLLPFLLLVFSLSFLHAQTPNEILATELDTYIQDEMSTQNIPGLSACIVKGDQVIWKAAYGMANIELMIPVTLETKFTLASISKLFVATACAQLWENGMLDIDTDINDYLPIDVINPNFPNTPMTVRQLLTHKSSLKDFESDLQIWEQIGDPSISLTEFCENYFVVGGDYYVASNYASTAPGQSNYWYSNAGFTLLGYIVQEVSEMPFDTYCKMNIQDPLGMNTAAWFYSNVEANSVAMPYNNNLQPQGYYSVPEYPAAMLKSNINELANFLIAYTQGGNFQGFELLQPTTFATVVPEDMMNGFGWWGKDTWYGDTSGTFWSHGGFMDGVRTQLNYYPSDESGLIILTNGEGSYGPIQNKIESYIPLFDENEVSIQDEINQSISIFPNPVLENGKLTINLNGVGVNNVECYIYNTIGSEVLKFELNQSQTTLDLSDLSEGIYFGKIMENENTLKEFKCIKN